MKFKNFKENDLLSLVKDLNNGLNKLDLTNFNGQTVTKETIATGEFDMQHTLKKVPSYMIILMQEGGTYITSVPKKWTDKKIVLKAGSATTKLTIFIGV